ncbi:hypothetical protein SODG_000724 [Sodalis praecaptivus]|nr:hypothetical protein NVIRENTERO_02339 [Sodalis praecaptivus]
MSQQVMLHANAFICAAACLRLMTYRRGRLNLTGLWRLLPGCSTLQWGRWLFAW